jgi:tol-pal system protein YbgF
LLAAAAALSGCVSSGDIESIQAQLGDLQRQVLQVQQQGSSKREVASLEEAVSTQMQALLKQEADMQVELQSLSTQIEQLQANLQDTNDRLAQLSQQIAATNQELRSRPAGAEAPLPADAPPDPAAAAGGDPQALYQAAYSDYLRKNYDLAILGFQQYLQAFPDTDLSDNAAYWIGECYYGQGKMQEAIQQFDHVLSQYPRSDKRASAWLKKGYAHLELGDTGQGVAHLRRVVKEFPSSDEANLARQRLRALGVN